MLFRGSRYEQTPTRTHVGADGTLRRYVGLRLVPDAPGATGHVVDAGERLDHIAARYLDDPELFWRVCDANHVIAPEDLLVAGRRIDLPRPGG
jgi:hypothetical protein